jgi:hypothetical protein
MMAGMPQSEHFRSKPGQQPPSQSKLIPVGKFLAREPWPIVKDSNSEIVEGGLTQEEINLYNKMDLKALQKEVDALDYDWKETNTKIEGISIKTYGERVVLREKEKLEAELNGKLNEIKRYGLSF